MVTFTQLRDSADDLELKYTARHLAQTLREIMEAQDSNPVDYESRYGLVLYAMFYAWLLKYSVGVRIDPAQPQWPVVYIELPTGQVSWHMPEHEAPFDGHGDRVKAERMLAYIDQHPDNGDDE